MSLYIDVKEGTQRMTGVGRLALSVRCPSCKAEPGRLCATRLVRGYHITRADRAVRRENRKGSSR